MHRALASNGTKGYILLAPSLLALFFACTAHSQMITIVEDSTPTSVIAWWTNGSTPSAEFAASELQEYFLEMSGAQVPVIAATLQGTLTNISSAVAVVTGPEAGTFPESPVLSSSLFDSMDSRLVVEDALCVRTTDNKILLAGTNERGTLYAAYRLLEILGVEFLAPDFDFYEGRSERTPATSTLAVQQTDLCEEPSFKYRREEIGMCLTHDPSSMVHLVDWMAKNRLNVLACPVSAWEEFRVLLMPETWKRGILLQIGGHEVYGAFLPESAYEAEHPDWFPEDDEPVIGVNTAPPANVFHVTNQEALQAFSVNGLGFLADHPEVDILRIWPPDGTKWAAGDIDEVGSMSNAAAHVLNTLKAEVDTGFPDTCISGISYRPATEPPGSPYAYDSGTIIDFAPYDRSYSEPIFGTSYPMNLYYDALFGAWRDQGFAGEAVVYEYYRKYSWHSLPVVLAELIGVEIPHYHSLGAVGLGTYSEPGDWLTYELTHLLVAKLLWNKNLQGDALLQDYLSSRFGVASGSLATYFRSVERAGRFLFDRPMGSYDDLPSVRKARDAYRAARAALLQASSLEGLDDSARFLIERMLINIDYAIADTEIDYFRLIGHHRESNEAVTRTRTLLSENTDKGILLESPVTERRTNRPPIGGMFIVQPRGVIYLDSLMERSP